MDYWHTLKAVFTNRAFVVSGHRRFVKITNCQLQNQCLRLLICIYKVIFLFLGGSMAFISCLATKMEQIMCRQVPSIFLPTSVPDCVDFYFFFILHQLHSVGYSDELAGLACTIVIIVGALGTVLFGVLAQVQWRPHQLID